MKYLIQFQINILALLILIALYLFTRNTKVRSSSKFLMECMIIASALGIIMEPLTWIFDGEKFIGAGFLEYTTNILLYLLAPIIAGLCLSYVDYRIYKDTKRINRRFFYQQMTVFTFIILIINHFYPIYFWINFQGNNYHAAQYNWVHWVIIGLLYLYMVQMILRNIHRLTMKESFIYLLCFLAPVSGMLIQVFNSFMYLSWSSNVFVLFMIYIFLETTPSEEDYLTKCYNRKSYEISLKYLMDNQRPFCLIILDLDYFKQINDNYGHNRGDEALIGFSEAMRNVVGRKDMVCRLGGDEFAIIYTQVEVDIHALILRIREELNRHPDSMIKNLYFSYGFEYYQEGITMDELYIKADNMMYTYKQGKDDRIMGSI